MLGGLFSSNVCTLEVALDHQKNRKTVYLDKDKKSERVYVYCDGEDVSGVAVISLKPGKKLDHAGVKVELVGELYVARDVACPHFVFFATSKNLEGPGTLTTSKSYRWKFAAVDKAYETYRSKNVQLRYYVKFSLLRPYANTLTKEVDFAVQNFTKEVLPSSSIKMEVGIEDCLHIEFEYDKSTYHLKDVVMGKVHFLLVRIKIKYMELDVVRSEAVRAGSSTHVETEAVTKFEIMDGAAAKGECVPVRLYLGGDMTPTYEDVAGKLSVKYYLNLVLVDEEDRRYFKKQEIFLYRKLTEQPPSLDIAPPKSPNGVDASLPPPPPPPPPSAQ